MEMDKPWIVAEAIQSALQAPFYHFILEGLLVIWILRLIFSKSYKIHQKETLTKKEKEELVGSWQPEPLVPPLEKTLAKTRPYRLVSGQVGKNIVVDGYKCKNFASMNFLGLVGNKRVEEKIEKCIRTYGVGTCGPRGFYGTFDVHLELEERIAKFIGAEEALIYSYGFATIASAIPAYAKRGDIIFVDEAVCFAIQKGLQASRSKIVYFKHNDMNDLEDKLIEQEKIDKKNPKKAAVIRKFMVVEGIYMNTGQICDLPKLVEFKFKYKVRLFVEESLSFGVLGDHGRGVTEHFNIPVSKLDLVVACMEYSLASVGGFCCGRHYVVGHQRLSGMGYVFSASLPSLLARAAIEGLNISEENPDIFAQLRQKAAFLQDLLKGIKGIELVGYPESPCFHLRRLHPVTPEKDLKFLHDVVDKCMKNGICITVASRLKEEFLSEWPASIRIAVSVEMSEEDLDEAARVIRHAVEEACNKCKGS
ncbi:serine palmitoyltransferase 1-like [Clavelina lepadiformis]|uniref:serine palmitoyltransferase 1-like n=1 Tax=Clavelina lepadiformis TaxID=159417 RepID=UPI0040431208